MCYDAPGQNNGHTDAISRLRLNDERNYLVAIFKAKIQKPFNDTNHLQKEIETNRFISKNRKPKKNLNWKLD